MYFRVDLVSVDGEAVIRRRPEMGTPAKAQHWEVRVGVVVFEDGAHA